MASFADTIQSKWSSLQAAWDNQISAFQAKYPTIYTHISKTSEDVFKIAKPVLVCGVVGIGVAFAVKPLSGLIAGVWINQNKKHLQEASPVILVALAVFAIGLTYFQPLFVLGAVAGYFLGDKFSSLKEGASNLKNALDRCYSETKAEITGKSQKDLVAVTSLPNVGKETGDGTFASRVGIEFTEE